MNCLLFGLGPHAKRIYWNYLNMKSKFNKIYIVDLISEKAKLEKFIENSDVECELILFENKIRNFKKLPEDMEEILKKYVVNENIQHAIISTEPRSHAMYINFCLDNNLSIMCDKPITAPLYANTEIGSSLIMEEYLDIMEKWENSQSEMFEIQTQRRAHKGYKYIKKILEDIVGKYNVPINKITITHSDGNWSMPSETVFRENHPYKYGYGKLMHSGYHFIDLLTFFTEINNKYGFKENHKVYKMSDYRPNDFFKYYGKEFNEKLGFYDNSEYYNNLDIIRNFGEFDISSIIDYVDAEDNIITTAHLQLTQSGYSNRSWFELPVDTYKGNGRIRHEFLDISIGPLINIKVLSYQSQEISNGNITDSDMGGLDHFDILIFRNSAIIGGKPFEVIKLNEIDDKILNTKYYLGQNEEARFEILNDFFFNKVSHSNVSKHKEGIEILTELHKLMAKRFKNDNFRFAVEVLIEYNGKFLICKRRGDLKVAPGIWNIPAGKVKYNEGIEEALIRETKEEINIDLKDFRYLGYHFINKQHKRLVFTYHSKLSDIKNFYLNLDEFEKFTWITKNQLERYDSLNNHLVNYINQISSEGE